MKLALEEILSSRRRAFEIGLFTIIGDSERLWIPRLEPWVRGNMVVMNTGSRYTARVTMFLMLRELRRLMLRIELRQWSQYVPIRRWSRRLYDASH